MMAHSGNVVGGRDATENTLTHRNTKSPRDDSEDEEIGVEKVEEETRALLESENGASTQGGKEDRDSRGHLVQSKGPFATWLDSVDPLLKFFIIVSLVFLFFGLHNILQEKLFAMPAFEFGWSLGMLEATGVLAGSALERLHGGAWNTRVAPFQNYILLAGLLGASSLLSNIALNYIKFTTKVIFRSCKLIPTMVIAVVWRKKFVSRGEFMSAAALCSGLIIFAHADSTLEPDFNPIGIAMVMLSVCADAFLPNLQEKVFTLGASRVEVTFFTNLLTVFGMVVSTLANGNMFDFIRYAWTNPDAATYMMIYCVCSHMAIASHMMVVKEYGGVTAVLVGGTRKAMTVALSFLLFPKPFSYKFVVGGALVLGGLVVNVKIKDTRRRADEMRNLEQEAAAGAATPLKTENAPKAFRAPSAETKGGEFRRLPSASGIEMSTRDSALANEPIKIEMMT